MAFMLIKNVIVEKLLQYGSDYTTGYLCKAVDTLSVKSARH